MSENIYKVILAYFAFGYCSQEQSALRQKVTIKEIPLCSVFLYFRKWFNTRCEIAGMKPTHIQILMNHSLGISDSYLRPTQNEILEDYLKAVDFLTINDKYRLQKQVTDVSKKAKEENSLVRAKLEQRDNDIAELKAAVAFLSDKVNAAIIANEPSSRVISDQKGIPMEITFTSPTVGNARAEIAK